MPIYTKPQIELLVDLINEANPGLNLAPVAFENTRLGLPYPYTPKEGEIADTSIEVFPRDNSFFVGRVVVNYRRLKLENLFKNRVIEYDRWRGRRLEREDLAKWLNRDFNTTFVPEDFSSSGWTSWGGVRYTNIHPHSLCYQGTFYFRWIQGKRELDQILDDAPWEFNKVFPQPGTRFWSEYHAALPHVVEETEEDDRRPLLTHIGFGLDYSRFYNNLMALSNGTVLDENTPVILTALRYFTQVTGIELSLDKDHTEVGGLRGLDYFRYSIPRTLIDEANAFDYQYAAWINAKEDSWFGGRLIFHFNREAIQLPFNELGYLTPSEFQYKTYDPQIRKGARKWELEEVHNDNYFPSTKRRLTEISGEFEIEPLSNNLPVPFTLELGNDVEDDTRVRFVARDANNGQVRAFSPTFLLTASFNTTVSTTTLTYGEPLTVSASNLPFPAGTVLNWTVNAIEGEWLYSNQGSATVENKQLTFDITVPFIETHSSVTAFVVDVTRETGEKVVGTPSVTLTGEVTVVEEFVYDDNFTTVISAGTSFEYEIIGGGGSGAGGTETGTGPVEFIRGGNGGAGERLTGRLYVTEEINIEGFIPTPAVGGVLGEDGLDTSPTQVDSSLFDGGGMTALGGRGGMTEQRDTAARGDGGAGGLGAVYDSETGQWTPSQAGEKGKVIIRILGKV